MFRNRLIWALAACAVVGLGLASRRYAWYLPEFLARYAGDTLWALMVFVMIGVLAPRLSTRWVASAALAFSYAVELSQLYHAPWLDKIRNTSLGGLVLGYGFLWSDVVCYTTGVAIGVAAELALRRFAAARCRR
jgi:hypothetical protein